MPATDDLLLLESGDAFLLESGDALLLESAPVEVVPTEPTGGSGPATKAKSFKQRILAKLTREIGRAAAIRYVRLLTVGPEVEDEAEMMSTSTPRTPGRI